VAGVRTYIGLGANMGDARATLTDALAALEDIPGAAVRGVSPLYRTAPVGVTDQPDFLNAVVALDAPATASPEHGAIGLLVALKDIERGAGRQRRRRWGPRELDLDLLLYGSTAIAVERPPEGRPLHGLGDPAAAGRLLEVPHPEMRERLFVLAPLADLAPDLVPPGWPESVEAARRRRAEAEGPDAVARVALWSDAERAWIGPSGRTITVEPPGREDADEVARVHTASAEAAYSELIPADPTGLARRTTMWRERLAEPGSGTFVARDGERIVGVLGVGDFRSDGAIGAVHVLYVHPAWWGSGAGQALIDRAHSELARHFDEATLTVLTANPRARRFYERNGWIEGETLVEAHFGGTPTEVTRYHRTLRSKGGPDGR
jgi:2-amino-4-hydroxy-6-hydroxymethyldihydropteridine diphosphokinase